MKSSDRMIVAGVLSVLLLAAFYFLVLSPKRQEATKLSEDIEALQAQLSEQEQVAAFAEEARRQFPRHYGRVVVMGKAVPDEADSASMMVQVSAISRRTGVNFSGISLGEGSGAATAAPAPAAPTPAPEGGETPAPAESTPVAGTPSVGSVEAPATEASAASLPIGASVGPAGFPTLPYTLEFDGGFFEIADFVAGMDELVKLKHGATAVVADGRLLTFDGFALEGGRPGSSPILQGTFAVTSYTTPEGEGLTMGASPTAPAPAPGQPGAVPASSAGTTP